MNTEIYFLFLVLIVSFLYASVGHGGASGYLALGVLFNLNPIEMKTSALILNVFVSAIAFIQYYRGKYFKWKLFFPFIILSIPLAFIGAKIPIATHYYKIILAICLIIALVRILGLFGKYDNGRKEDISFIPAVVIGGIIGFISGMIGIGGGILLTPVLLLCHWANMKESAAISAAFIFLNSVSGLAGAAYTEQPLSSNIYLWAGVAIMGGTSGAYFGSQRFNKVILKYVLSLVLLFACFKLIFS